MCYSEFVNCVVMYTLSIIYSFKRNLFKCMKLRANEGLTVFDNMTKLLDKYLF